MGSQLVQIIILAGIALFLILRLKNVLGTREGFEKPREIKSQHDGTANRNFEVIEGGTVDHDIADFVDVESDTGKALVEMKKADPEFSVAEFSHGARAAYEAIVVAYEEGDTDTLRDLLSPDVYQHFEAAIDERANRGYSVDATFVGIREVRITDALYDKTTNEADITVRFVGELTSVVKDADGEIVEGSPDEVKQQKDVWTFTRDMTSENPNWLLSGTGG
ncbi:Tim44/TimA family putative adaptor protein [Amaricoccus tamworthensis]|uniref:Tim44/TimA family putative adaptor protein n=1 Tax=Amaricoccus tamworthensis TaxID=57002 RepID=UPI003C7E2871